jgi:3,4-dihydroxy-2-butanone 4-phosphate synthase
MVAKNEDPHRTAYTVTVDFKHGMQITSQASSHAQATRITL